MPLNSVQHYVKSLLDNLVIPGYTPTLEAYITPPTVEDIDRPKAYIWGGRLKGTRQTAPRGAGGYKKLIWSVDVYLVYETNPDSATVDSEFPIIIDTVMNTTWTTTMPVFIDANGVVVPSGTSGASQILQIGEDFELEYPPERTPATLRMLYYTARLSLEIYEAVQA